MSTGVEPTISLDNISTVDISSPMAFDPNEIAEHLPLPPATLHILLALAAGDRHGYGIIQDVEERTGGDVTLSAGTLYRTIQRLLERGLISEPRTSTRLRDDPRRRYYRITPLGRAVARAESQRLSDLVRVARGVGLLSPESP